jgi:uncharacterized protein (TIGR02118 family)
MKKGMISVSVYYPNGEGNKFNIDYYCSQHAALVNKLFGDRLKGFSVDRGVGGGAPGEAALYLAVGHLYFDTVEDFQQAFGPNAEEIMRDMPNYTNSQPVVQVNEVVL